MTGRRLGYPRGVYFWRPLFYFPRGEGFLFPAPFFRPRGRVFTLIRPLFSRAAPPVFITRRVSRIYPRGVYLSAVGGIFHAIITAFPRISAHFRGISRRAPSGAAGG